MNSRFVNWPVNNLFATGTSGLSNLRDTLWLNSTRINLRHEIILTKIDKLCQMSEMPLTNLSIHKKLKIIYEGMYSVRS